MTVASVALVRPGDIVLFHGTGTGAALIRWATSSYWNHAALIDTQASNPADLRLLESSGHGVHPAYLSEHLHEDYAVLRPKGATPAQGEAAVAAAVRMGVSGYDWPMLARLAMWRLLGRPLALTPETHDGRLICSELVEDAWEQAGVDLVPVGVAATPASLAKSPSLAWIYGEERW